MKIGDMIRQSLQNLLRHKGRTFLTVLGVIVGCCSVVALVSIGIGYSEVQKAILDQMGDLTEISVSIPYTDVNRILDQSIAQDLEEIDHVKAVIPTVSYYESTLVTGNGNRYKANYFEILGEDFSLAEIDGYELIKGDWDALKKNEIVIGQYFAYLLEDTMRPEGRNMIYIDDYYDWDTMEYIDLPDPYMDLLDKTVTLIIGDISEESEDNVYSVDFTVAGILSNKNGEWGVTENGIMMNLETLQEILDKHAIINNMKKQSDYGYDNITVKVDEINNVEDVEKDIKRRNLYTYSLDETRKSTEQMVRQAEMMLGGIGAIALFVAALGIANTMIMAIAERTKEIGIMKALGCFVRNIREMFLFEAGFIGLLGGIIGIGLSYGISIILNSVGMGMLFSSDYDYLIDTTSMDISVIPWWLAVFAVLFSMLVGILAGLYPAGRAVKISVLEAIRRE